MDSFVNLFIKEKKYDDAISYINTMQSNLSTGSQEWVKVSAYLAFVYALKAIHLKEHPDSETVVNAENLASKIFKYNAKDELAHFVLGIVFLIKGYRESALKRFNTLMTLGREGVRLAGILKEEIAKKRG